MSGPSGLSPWRRWAVAVASVCALVVAPGAGQAGEEKAAGTPEALVLFDGKSLDGWKGTDFSRPGAVQVEGGTLVLSAGRPRTGITRTRKDLPAVDDELSDEAMRRDGGDFFAAAKFPVGTSFLTRVNGGWGGNVTGLSRLDGADASENETSRFFQDEDKTWYRSRVRVTSARIRWRIDAKEVVAVDDRERPVGTRIETRGNQPLGFATWETSGTLRNLTIRKLTPAEVAATNASAK